MDEIKIPVMIILLSYIVYRYRLYKNSLRVNNCTIVYKPE